ncbi:unnamed protein product [Prunus armeniaca]
MVEKGLTPLKDESYFTNGFLDKRDKASAVVLLTFDALEQEILDALSSMLIPPIYTIGPIELLLVNQIPEDPLKSVG